MTFHKHRWYAQESSMCFHIITWRHNDPDGVSNHQPHGCLLNRLFRRRSKKTSKLRVSGLCVGNSPGPVNTPHKGPVTRKMFPFDDVIMFSGFACTPVLLSLFSAGTTFHLRHEIFTWEIDISLHFCRLYFIWHIKWRRHPQILLALYVYAFGQPHFIAYYGLHTK